MVSRLEEVQDAPWSACSIIYVIAAGHPSFDFGICHAIRPGCLTMKSSSKAIEADASSVAATSALDAILDSSNNVSYDRSRFSSSCHYFTTGIMYFEHGPFATRAVEYDETAHTRDTAYGTYGIRQWRRVRGDTGKVNSLFTRWRKGSQSAPTLVNSVSQQSFTVENQRCLLCCASRTLSSMSAYNRNRSETPFTKNE